MGAGNLAVDWRQIIRLPAGVRSRYFAGGHPVRDGRYRLAGIPAMLNRTSSSMPPIPYGRSGIHSVCVVCGLLALCGVIGFMIGLIRLSERRAIVPP